jgi:aldehyde:ferredoxin oxidoreductase
MATGKKYVNRILRINLKTGDLKNEVFDPEELRKWVGGNGTALKILYDEVKPDIKPLSPENKLIFAAGPLNGTRIPGTGTFEVATKGPLTGMLTSAQANGFFGARMRHVGYETIILEEAAQEWSYIWIDNGNVEIRSAEHLLGLDTWQTEDKLKEELGKPRASVVCVGPAAENMIPFCAIMSDHGHAAATNGPGTVMASKKIKAIVISSDSNEVDIWDESLNKEIRKEFLENAEKSYMGSMIKHMGTHGYYNGMSMMGALTIKNYTTEVWPTINKYFGDVIGENWDRKKNPCWACPWGHCTDVTIKTGKAKGYTGEEPEYEAVSAWTLNIGSDDIGESVRLQNICDGMGFDLKEVTYTISLVMECFNDGILTLEDTEGLDLTWGNTDSVAQLLQDIAHKRGFGAKLTKGVKATAEMIGGEAPQKAVYMGRGLAPNVVNGRPYWPLWYNMAMSDTGSFYCNAGQDPEIGNPEPVGLFDADKIGKYAPNNSKKTVMQDCVGICNFFVYGGLQPTVNAVNAATGWDMTIEEFLEVGDRIRALSRAYNILNGLTPEMEMAVSPRYARDPVDGPAAGFAVQVKRESVFRDYYEYSGWDRETSKPLPETLEKLDLEFIIKDMWPEYDKALCDSSAT